MEDSSDESESMETSYKLTVVARTDLNMSAGKLASQVGHAVAETFTGGKAQSLKLWQDDGGMIVVLQAAGEDALLKLQSLAKSKGVVTKPVYDHGLTEVADGTLTALAVGPDEVSRVDSVSGRLQLLRDVGEASSSKDEIEQLQNSLEVAQAEAQKLHAKNAELEQRLRSVAEDIATPSPALPSDLVWFSRELALEVPQAVCPEFFEMWTWEGDSTVLPSKWEEALQECCHGQVASVGRKPWQNSSFDEQGIFFITSRSETCGIAVALPGSCDSDGIIAALGVKPWCRRRGIGRCLLRLCLQRHAELGRSRVHMVCSTSEPKQFRESENFKILGTLFNAEGFVVAAHNT